MISNVVLNYGIGFFQHLSDKLLLGTVYRPPQNVMWSDDVHADISNDAAMDKKMVFNVFIAFCKFWIGY